MEPNSTKKKEPPVSEPGKPTCEVCGGKGWLLCNVGNDASPRDEVQRCDHSEKYDGDGAALEAVVAAAKSQPQLLVFAQSVSLLTHEGEPDERGQPFEIASEDAIATLNQLISEARQLVGSAKTCSSCGEIVPYVIGCPDGAEVCQECFNSGQH